MKTIATIALLFCFQISLSQILVNDIDINALPDLRYIQLSYVEMPVAFSQKNAKGTLRIDYGQDFKKVRELIVKDKEGKVIEFNSHIDVLNFFYKNGWSLFSTYTSPSTTNYVSISTILERRQ